MKYYSSALAHNQWRQAVHDEYNTLVKNKTWSLAPLPPNRRAVGYKWVLLKRNPDGSVSRYKGRLVAKEFHQQASQDFSERLSPVVKPTTIEVVLTVALSRGWTVRQLDINNAFLNEILKEDIYME